VYSSSGLCISEVRFCFFQSAMMKIVIRETGMDAVVVDADHGVIENLINHQHLSLEQIRYHSCVDDPPHL